MISRDQFMYAVKAGFIIISWRVTNLNNQKWLQTLSEQFGWQFFSQAIGNNLLLITKRNQLMKSFLATKFYFNFIDIHSISLNSHQHNIFKTELLCKWREIQKLNSRKSYKGCKWTWFFSTDFISTFYVFSEPTRYNRYYD